MLVIRLSRTGKKSQPSYRVVVQEHTNAPSGKAVEIVGDYMPTMDPKIFRYDAERIKYWISVGAQPSDRVASLLKADGMSDMDQYIGPRQKKRKKKKEVEEAPAAPAAPAAEAAPAEGGDAPAEAPAETPAEEAPAAE